MIRKAVVFFGMLVLWLDLVSGAQTVAQTRITIGVAAMSPRTIPLLGAQEQGLFAKHGIDARIVLIKRAPTLVASLISGDIEAIVVNQEFLQKRGDVAERILMALVNSLAYTLAPPNKSPVTKTMMTRFHISDPSIADEGYQDLLTSVERKPLPSRKRCATFAGSWPCKIPKRRTSKSKS